MSSSSPLKLPARPSLDHLKQQAYDLQREAKTAGRELQLAEAYHELAKQYGFASWPKFKAHVEFLGDETLQAAIKDIENGDADGLRRLLATSSSLIHSRAPNGYTLLHFASGSKTERNPRRAEVIDVLIDAGLPVDTRLPGGETSLHFAATFPDTERVNALLRRGARPDLCAAGDGGTPLVHALFYGHADVADLLAQQAILPRNLRVAAGLGRIDLIERFFEERRSLTSDAGAHREFYRCHDGFPSWTVGNNPDEIIGEAFAYAAKNGRREAVLWFLDVLRIDINTRPYRNSTALHWAAFRGRREVVELLIEHGADVDIHDDAYNGYPWGWAGQKNHMELERYLIGHSRNLDIFQACNFNAGVDVVRRMLDRDPALVHARQGDPPSCGRHCRGTALHEAVDWWKPDVARLLLDRGADINARTEKGATPLAIALERKNDDAIELLKSCGGVM